MFYYFWKRLKLRNMKRNFIIAFLLLGVVTAAGSFAQITHVGAAGHYGTTIAEFGAGANVFYTINEKIDIVPGLTYFLPHKVNYTNGYTRDTWWEISLDGHYIPIENTHFQAYGLMGLNFTSVEEKSDTTFLGQRFKDRKTSLELGLNIGGGIQFNMTEKIKPFAQAKYTMGEASQFVFSVGILFRIKEDAERENPEDL